VGKRRGGKKKIYQSRKDKGINGMKISQRISMGGQGLEITSFKEGKGAKKGGTGLLQRPRSGRKGEGTNLGEIKVHDFSLAQSRRGGMSRSCIRCEGHKEKSSKREGADPDSVNKKSFSAAAHPGKVTNRMEKKG